MAAGPGPGMINIMKNHEDLCLLMIDDPGGSSEMRKFILTGQNIGIPVNAVQHPVFVFGFLQAARPVSGKTAAQISDIRCFCPNDSHNAIPSSMYLPM